MARLVFSQTIEGFYEWLGQVRKIKFRYYLMCANRGAGLIELHYEEFLDIKRFYIQYLQFLLTLNRLEKEYVKSFINHHSPSRIISRQIDIHSLYKIWIHIIFEIPGMPSIKKITNKEVGFAIKEARQIARKSRKATAEILNISVESLKAYEEGKRKIPFILFNELSQIFEINIK